MMKLVKHKSGVQTIRNVLDEKDILNWRAYLNLLIANNALLYEKKFNSYSMYAEVVGESMLLFALPMVEKAANCKLLPAYSFTRRYVNGAIMPKHKDRNACEVSCTLTLDYQTGESWPIFVEFEGSTHEVPLEPGQMLYYRGCEMPHWRNRFSGDHSTHCFLHYIEAEGDHLDHKFDGRDNISATNQFKKTLKERLFSLKKISEISFDTKIQVIKHQPYQIKHSGQMITFNFNSSHNYQITVPFFAEDLMKQLLNKTDQFVLNDFKGHPYEKAVLQFSKELVLKGFWDIVPGEN